LAVVAEQRVATCLAVLVRHCCPLQQQFAHPLGVGTLVLVVGVLLPELLAFGFLVEVAHRRANGRKPEKHSGLIMCR